MRTGIEFRKLKRTGFLPASLTGSLLAAIIPAGNMGIRYGSHTGLQEPALRFLLNENWRMMTMLNLFLIIIGACVVYHTEYADNALQKMDALPLRHSSVFFSKLLIITLAALYLLILEGGSLAFCSHYWFLIPTGFTAELLKAMGYEAVLLMPALILITEIASLFKNMWMPLGICTICIFSATMIHENSFILSLFPFALPFRTLYGAEPSSAARFLYAAGAEAAFFTGTGIIFFKLRRIYR